MFDKAKGLHQQTLEQVQSAKYLGLTITDNLDWGQHISEITCKSTKTLPLGFLRRNLALAPRHTKEVAYKTLVRPQLEYAAPIWHPYNETQECYGVEGAEDCSQVDLQEMEELEWTGAVGSASDFGPRGNVGNLCNPNPSSEIAYPS